jgi:hypothetical protein
MKIKRLIGSNSATQTETKPPKTYDRRVVRRDCQADVLSRSEMLKKSEGEIYRENARSTIWFIDAVSRAAKTNRLVPPVAPQHKLIWIAAAPMKCVASCKDVAGPNFCARSNTTSYAGLRIIDLTDATPRVLGQKRLRYSRVGAYRSSGTYKLMGSQILKDALASWTGRATVWKAATGGIGPLLVTGVASRKAEEALWTTTDLEGAFVDAAVRTN